MHYTVDIKKCFIIIIIRCLNYTILLQTYDKQKLRQITKTDERALSFVFYMKSDRSKHMRFESALYSGWFIQIVNVNADCQVKMATKEECKDDPSFIFIIQKNGM